MGACSLSDHVAVSEISLGKNGESAEAPRPSVLYFIPPVVWTPRGGKSFVSWVIGISGL